MRPFYERDGITILHGDAADRLPDVAPGSIDAVIADPPYGETSLGWDRRLRNWPALVMPLLKASGSLWCFGSMRMFLESASEFSGWRFAQDLVWEKQNGSGFLADRFKRVHENALQFYLGAWNDVFKSPVTTNDAQRKQTRRKHRPSHMGGIAASVYESEDGGPRLMRSVLMVRNCHGSAVHPTQKPVGIVEPLARYSVPPGGVILDPFMGSGTTLLVARALGMRAIGIEISEEYCAVAVGRLEAAQSSFRLGVA